jgi:hypothetical protein
MAVVQVLCWECEIACAGFQGGRPTASFSVVRWPVT